jgi:FkbM family methyltransferase
MRVNSYLFKVATNLLPSLLCSSAEKLIDYKIGKYIIRLPPDHKLPEYDKLFPQYDRFLPHLAAYMEPESVIIDVGANCADTVAAMASRNPRLQFLCVEADDKFFEYLTSNIRRIQDISPALNIIPVKALAGKNISGVILTGTNGTKSATHTDAVDPNSRLLTSKTLDEIVHNSEIPIEKVSLIKVDTDGYDYDVIVSAEQIIRYSHPLLFFECQFVDETQKNEFKSLLHTLERHGYMNWAVFDNFGALMMRVASIDDILQLIDYIWLQNRGKSARTIYYLDILASTQLSAATVEAMLNAYNDV